MKITMEAPIRAIKGLPSPRTLGKMAKTNIVIRYTVVIAICSGSCIWGGGTGEGVGVGSDILESGCGV